MAGFCSRCGQPLGNNNFCSCGAPNPQFNQPRNISSYVESMKNRMGIGEPELNQGDAFERGKLIVPNCISANEGEVPVRQYKVATLRNRIFGITYDKSEGRMQVTNKRVIFRAAGRSIVGRTTLQHEFAIDELAGVEARREYVFNFWDILIGMFVGTIGGYLILALMMAIANDGGLTGAMVLSLLFGIVGCIPFFMLKKKWLLKLLCLGCSLEPTLILGLSMTILKKGSYATISKGQSFLATLLLIVGILSLVMWIFTLIVFAIKPNLVLVVKTKSASEAIDIRRKKNAFSLLGSIFGGIFGKSGVDMAEHTGYTEVLPDADAERCIREINSVIIDIQKLGDHAIEKWRM